MTANAATSSRPSPFGEGEKENRVFEIKVIGCRYSRVSNPGLIKNDVKKSLKRGA